MKKSIAFVMLFLMLSSPCSAFVPVVVGAWLATAWGQAITASLVLHMSAWGAYMYSKRSGGSTVNGNEVSIPQEFHYIEVDLNSIPTEMKTQVPAKLPTDALYSAAKGGSAKYPKLYEATVGGALPGWVEVPDAIGSGFNVWQQLYKTSGGETYQCSYIEWSGSALPVGFTPDKSRYYSRDTVYNGTIIWGATKRNVMADATKETFMAKVVDGNNVKTEFQGEIDDYITSTPNIVHFDDEIPPIPDAAKIDAAIAKQKINDANVKLAENAHTTISNASTALADREAVYQALLAAEAAARSASNAAPGNQALADAATAASAAATKGKNAVATAQNVKNTAQTKLDEIEAQAADDKAAGGSPTSLLGDIKGFLAGLLGPKGDGGNGNGKNADGSPITSGAGSGKPMEDPDTEAATVTAGDGKYDATVTSPEKKDIKSMITSFIQSSPLLAFGRSVTFQAESGDTAISFQFAGHTVTADWRNSITENLFNTLGAIMLMFAHVYAVYIIFRREAD